ncbi:hypothetical protein [Shewanella psychromarinicola]|uniref:hypothetical protein n=1 Tax=Shewanella psychromarinicola TaxID=2487742 RepID=UPI003F4B8AD8
MKKYNAIKSVLPAILLSTLTACGGSDSDPVTEVPPTEPPVASKPHESLDLVRPRDAVFDGDITIYLGKWYPCMEREYKADGLDISQHCTGDEAPTPNGKYNDNEFGRNTVTANDSKYIFKVNASDMKAWAALPDSPIPLQPDVYADGRFSVMDVVLYASHVRDDLDVTASWNDELKTYVLSTAWDTDGDGTLSEGELSNRSPDWYPNYIWDDGSFDRLQGGPTLETVYVRADLALAKTPMRIRIQPFSPAVTQRRNMLFKAQADRRLQTGDKVILPVLVATDVEGYRVVEIENLEVTAHNLRTDIFKPGVVTQLDAWLSAHDQGLLDYTATYWGIMSTGAKVNGYAHSSINGIRSQGMQGWTAISGEQAAFGDFFQDDLEWPSPSDLIAADMGQGDRKLRGKCRWMHGGKGHTIASAQVCIDEWYNKFGGNADHDMIDQEVISYAPMIVSAGYAVWMPGQFDITELHYADENGYYENMVIADIKNAVAPLTEEHFGWGIADCRNCHDDVHQGSLGVEQPYECASCHGSNGAMKGHGEVTRCFWCHTEDNQMANHGSASGFMKFGDVVCDGTSRTGLNLAGMEEGGCANAAQKLDAARLAGPNGEWGGIKQPIHDQADNLLPYRANERTGINSDWHNSEDFPDPYSCVTCHPND